MEFAFSSSIDIDPGKTLFWQLRVVLNPLQMLASCRQAAAPVSIAAASDIRCVFLLALTDVTELWLMLANGGRC